MSLADQVRSIYERRPYPFGNDEALRRSMWSLDLAWVDTFGRDAGAAEPARVLVAGCGDGAEAFALQRVWPSAGIVAVDFSPRSIALARRLQKRDAGMGRIRFDVADITAPGLAAALGGKFDLIVCHGVLAYVPDTAGAMRTFARCLARDGVLYVGANGSAHVSSRLRRALPQLGIDLNGFKDSARTRATLRFCDTAIADEGPYAVACQRPAYLATDVFGAVNLCLPLTDWVERAREAGLHFRGSAAALKQFRRVAGGGCLGHLIPRSRAGVAELLELLSPAVFHRMLFSLGPERNPPWTQRRQLLRWRVRRSPLYAFELPQTGPQIRDRLRGLTLKCPSQGVSMKWRMPEWEIELLRTGDGASPVGAVLRDIPLAVPFGALREQLYLLHQTGIATLLPPTG